MGARVGKEKRQKRRGSRGAAAEDEGDVSPPAAVSGGGSDGSDEETTQGLVLLCCAAEGNTEGVREALDGGVPLSSRDGPNNPLMTLPACLPSHHNFMLTKHRYNVDVVCWGHNMAHHLAAGHDHADVVSLLLERGAGMEEVNGARATPLHCAAQGGAAESALVLLGRGARVDTTNWADCTPLHISAAWGREDITRLLLEYGANTRSHDIMSNTVLHQAVLGTVAIYQPPEKHVISTLRVLLVEGGLKLAPDILNAKNLSKDTPLAEAIVCGRACAVSVLLEECGASLDMDSSAFGRHDGALQCAVDVGCLDCIRALVGGGWCDLEAMNEAYCTAVETVVLSEGADVVRVLTECGAVLERKRLSTLLFGGDSRNTNRVLQLSLMRF